MKPWFQLMWLCGAVSLAACVAPGVQGPGGSVQGTANVERLERQSPVTPPPVDTDGNGYYGNGPYYRGYYGPYYRGRYDRYYP